MDSIPNQVSVTYHRQIVVRLNAAEKKFGKSCEDVILELGYGQVTDFTDLCHEMCEALGVKWTKHCRIYDKEGVSQFEDDVCMWQENDVYYIAPQGKFSPSHNRSKF